MVSIKEVIDIIEKIPTAEENMAALVVDSKVYTWREILVEMKKESVLAKRMLPEIDNIRKSCKWFLGEKEFSITKINGYFDDIVKNLNALEFEELLKKLMEYDYEVYR